MLFPDILLLNLPLQLCSPLLGFFEPVQGFVEVDQETQRFLSVWMFVAELVEAAFCYLDEQVCCSFRSILFHVKYSQFVHGLKTSGMVISKLPLSAV